MDTGVLPVPVRASTERRVMLRLAVEADSITRVQQAILAVCGGVVQFLLGQKVPRSTQRWLWLVLEETRIPDALLATLRAVPCGEIGPVYQQLQHPPTNA